MSLLVDIAIQALDPGYAEAAARRDQEQRSRQRRRPALAAAAVVAAVLLIVIAGVQAHLRAPAAARTHNDLVAAIGRQDKAVTGLERQLGVLRARTAALRDRALASSAAGARLARLIATEELVAGTGAVTGPGLRVVVEDAPASGGRPPANRVLDRDLQALVNALWAAGAEAVAVNGQRLTAQSAIRQAGDAILVNFAPVHSPYVLEAIGEPVSLETSFAASRAAGRLRTYTQLYGLRFHYDRTESLTLPPAPGLTLRYASPVPPRSGGGGHR